MEEIKELIKQKIKTLLNDVIEDAEMSFGIEEKYISLILKYMELLERMGE